jgi:hypothetical protein
VGTSPNALEPRTRGPHFLFIHARPKAARLTPHRTPCASALVSGLRSEASSPPRSAPAGPQRDAPDTQRRWRTRPPRDLSGGRARAAAALKHVAGTGRRTRRGSASGELRTLSRARRRCTQRRRRLGNPTFAASSHRLGPRELGTPRPEHVGEGEVARSSTAEPARRPRRTTASRLCSSGSVCMPRLLTSSLRVLIEAQAPGLYVCVFSPPSTVPQARCSHVCRRFECSGGSVSKDTSEGPWCTYEGYRRRCALRARAVLQFTLRRAPARRNSIQTTLGLAWPNFFPSALFASMHAVCCMYTLK